MKEQTLEKYQIRFENKEYIYPFSKSWQKNIFSNNLFLTGFLFDFQSPKSLNNILNLLEERHHNPEVDGVEWANYGYIEISYDTVIIYASYCDDKFIFPFEEFEEIIMAYYKFLTTPPLAGEYSF